jgi:hypothetical protein
MRGGKEEKVERADAATGRRPEPRRADERMRSGVWSA